MTFKDDMREAAYNALLKVNPKIIKLLKAHILIGDSPEQIEKAISNRFGKYNLAANAAILAAYHLKAHPELLHNAATNYPYEDSPI